MTADDDLARFELAQASCMADVTSELAAGRKRTHWMWFVFPQLRGLGQSQLARHFGLASRAEAEAYLAHPLLGPRLRECVERVLRIEGLTPAEIVGSPDDLKLRSCLTLFRAIDGVDGVFGRAIDQCFEGRVDPLTLKMLGEPT